MTDSRDPSLIELIGVDGSVWTLSGSGRGRQGVDLGVDPSGLWSPPVTTIWTGSAFQEGATYGGKRVQKRDIVFSVNITETSDRSWEEVNSDWHRAWSFDEDCALVITTPISGSRELRLRLSEEIKEEWRKDPRLQASSKALMTCVAGFPWWTGHPEVSTGTAVGANGTLRFDVFNPTDQKSWLQWVIEGPGIWSLPDYSWADDEHAFRGIQMPSIVSGETVTVDSHPLEETAISNLNPNYWARMGIMRFLYPVPPHTPLTTVNVHYSQSQAGASVMLRQPRHWARPFGGH